MSAPRPIIPGTSYLITRRCSERRFFLKPHPTVNHIVLYCLAFAAYRCDILIHAFVVLSNHYHIVLTDPRGLLPHFEQLFDVLVARALNALYRRSEAFWAPGTYSAVQLVDPEAILDKIAYTLANPVSAGLVSRSDLWPGLISRPKDIGAPPKRVRRPNHFFRQHGPQALPKEVPFGLVPPPCFGHLPLEQFRELVASRAGAAEDEARRKRQGRPFLGRRAVLRQSIYDRPASSEPGFKLNPRVAAGDPEKRKGALERLRAFVEAYRRAWKQFRAGIRMAVFPAGTWKLRWEVGVLCEAPS